MRTGDKETNCGMHSKTYYHLKVFPEKANIYCEQLQSGKQNRINVIKINLILVSTSSSLTGYHTVQIMFVDNRLT